MKTFKFLMPFMLAVLVIAGCNTDDLRNDIDELKNRVESLEAQVASINENMNVLRVLIDGNKTITSCVYDETTDKYTLTLSDGNVLTLTQGQTGTVNYPTITVNDEGFWTINGDPTGTKAEAENGKTPQFQIEEGTNYWQVRFSDEENWQYVYSNGEKVAATSDNVNTDDKFFEKVDADENYFYVTLKGASEPLKLPIVQDLKCAIQADGIIGYDNNEKVLSMALSGKRSIPMTILGDNYIITAPFGWKASITKGEGESATLELEAPATLGSTLTRAVADNTMDVVVQVNKGIYWAIDKLQVKVVDVLEDYYTKYITDGTITINGVTIDNTNYGNAILVTAENEETYKTISASGTGKIYFIDPGFEYQVTFSNNFDNLILIGNNGLVKSEIKPLSNIKLVNESSSGLLYCYNLNITDANPPSNSPNYLIAHNKDNTTFDKVSIDNCIIDLTKGKNLLFTSNSNKRKYNTIQIKNSLVKVRNSSQQIFLVPNNENASLKVDISNNIFYFVPDASNSQSLCEDFRLFNAASAVVADFVIENNSFINLNFKTNGCVVANTITNIRLNNNLYFVENHPVASYFVRCTTYPKKDNSTCTNNLLYKANSEFEWALFYSNGQFEGAEDIREIDTDPFEGGTFDPTKGIFKPNSTYSQYGANLE